MEEWSGVSEEWDNEKKNGEEQRKGLTRRLPLCLIVCMYRHTPYSGWSSIKERYGLAASSPCGEAWLRERKRNATKVGG